METKPYFLTKTPSGWELRHITEGRFGLFFELEYAQRVLNLMNSERA